MLSKVEHSGKKHTFLIDILINALFIFEGHLRQPHVPDACQNYKKKLQINPSILLFITKDS